MKFSLRAQELSGLLGGVCLAAAPVATAGTVLYPTVTPAFRLELPAGWTTQQNQNQSGVLTCFSSDRTVAVLLHATPKSYTTAEALTELPLIVRHHFEISGDAGIDIKPPHPEPAGKVFHAIPYVFEVVAATSKDVRMIYSFFLFTTPSGRSFVIEEIVPAAWFKAHQEEFWTILESVGPVD